MPQLLQAENYLGRLIDYGVILPRTPCTPTRRHSRNRR
jgi:hypothetical protein